MILAAIFEPTFSDNSHGFRDGRSCHTALKQIKKTFGAASFFIEGDISKCFDSFDHKILMGFIEKKILDRRFTKLIEYALKAGYLEFREIKASITGTPQGSIISPILANIYLHALDQYMEERCAAYRRGDRAKVNPVWRSWANKRDKAKKNGDTAAALHYLKEMQKVESRLRTDPGFRRMYYVRYADDWIVAIRGPREDAVNLMHDIRGFLKETLKLELSLEKTKITNPHRESALFLGTEITHSCAKPFTKGKSGEALRTTGQIRLLAPKLRIYKKLAAANFMNLKTGQGTPKLLWYHQSKEAILRLYISVYNGYVNYYSFANNLNHLSASLQWILRRSCAKLLAAKFSLRRAEMAMKRFGRGLKGTDKLSFPLQPKRLNPWDFKTQVEEVVKTMYSSGLSIASLENLTCKKCGATEDIEMHHIRKMSDINPSLSEVNRIMVKHRRKQIPLCRTCHLDHHKTETPWKSQTRPKMSKKLKRT